MEKTPEEIVKNIFPSRNTLNPELNITTEELGRTNLRSGKSVKKIDEEMVTPDNKNTRDTTEKAVKKNPVSEDTPPAIDDEVTK